MKIWNRNSIKFSCVGYFWSCCGQKRIIFQPDMALSGNDSMPESGFLSEREQVIETLWKIVKPYEHTFKT